MTGFEPQTKGQEALHAATLRQFNIFFEHRRERVHQVTTAVPAILWYTVAVGALVNMFLMWLFDLRLGTHLLLTGVVSFFFGTMIALILLLDRPFQGAVSVSPDAYELVYDQLMRDEPAGSDCCGFATVRPRMLSLINLQHWRFTAFAV